MRLLAVLLLALAPLAVTAQPTDPCDLAGTYALDRKPIHDDVIASMNESLAELGDRPAEGSFAEIQWSAKKEAFQGVRAQAEAGDIVPHMTIELGADGTFRHRVEPTHDGKGSNHDGQWSADRACQTLTIDVDDNDEPTTARIDGDRLILPNSTERRRGILNGVSFDRVRR